MRDPLVFSFQGCLRPRGTFLARDFNDDFNEDFNANNFDIGFDILSDTESNILITIINQKNFLIKTNLIRSN